MIYLARPKGGTLALAEREHHDIRWCSPDDLDALTPTIAPPVRWYCEQAIQLLSSGAPPFSSDTRATAC